MTLLPAILFPVVAAHGELCLRTFKLPRTHWQCWRRHMMPCYRSWWVCKFCRSQHQPRWLLSSRWCVVPVVKGYLVHFDGTQKHDTIINSGSVMLLGPFLARDLNAVVRCYETVIIPILLVGVNSVQTILLVRPGHSTTSESHTLSTAPSKSWAIHSVKWESKRESCTISGTKRVSKRESYAVRGAKQESKRESCTIRGTK